MLSTSRPNFKKGDYVKMTQLSNEMDHQTENGASSSSSSGCDWLGGDPSVSEQNPRKPLNQTVNIPAAILPPYRFIIFARMVLLVFFLKWRLQNPNDEAMLLWGFSVVCEIWFAISWLLDQLPKLYPINRVADLNVLKDKFETPSPTNPTGKSDLPGVDIFVSTADPEKEPPLVTANSILSILAANYPVHKLSCYVSDDGGSLLTFEAMAMAARFANLWVPFCRKHDIEPRNPESYFGLKTDPYKNKVRSDFVKDRRKVMREYEEFKVWINDLPDSIQRRDDVHNGESIENLQISKATWMADGTHWPGTWTTPAPEHSRGDHSSIIQVILKPPSDEPQTGSTSSDSNAIDLTEVDIRLPMLAYVSREKRPGCDHNKKAGAMNSLVRASAIMSNGPFILNLDCDHYIYISDAVREGICYMMGCGGDKVCFVQFPQRFEGVDPSDRYANHNTVFFDVSMRALDGIQGPVYVGSGCLFRRTALYGFHPPRVQEEATGWFGSNKKNMSTLASSLEVDSLEDQSLRSGGSIDGEEMSSDLLPKRFGISGHFVNSTKVAEFQGRPLADHPSIKEGREPGALTLPRNLLDDATIDEANTVISCWYEDKTEWGNRVGWIYGSVTEDVVTGYRMHNRGWRSVYCVPKRDAFRGTAPINLTDRLHQVLRWATGSVEIFFSWNNAILANCRLNFLQRIAYLNVEIYPFTSVFLIIYCFLPALSLFSGQFTVQSLEVPFLVYLLGITVTFILLAVIGGTSAHFSAVSGVLEAQVPISRNEQFWCIGGTSAHFSAVLQGMLKVVAGIEISFTLTSKSSGDGENDEFGDLYIIKWSLLMIPPVTIMMVNLIAIGVAVSRTIYSENHQWSSLLGGVFFSFWVLAHFYPFAKGLMGRRDRDCLQSAICRIHAVTCPWSFDHDRTVLI